MGQAAPSAASSAAAPLPQPQEDQRVRLFDLPPEVDNEIFPFLGADLSIGLARLRRTCKHGRQHVDADLLKSQIDTQLTGKGLKDVISYDLPSLDLLQRLLYIIDKSGDWAATVRIIRVAVHQGRGGGQLPIELTSADVEGVGSRAVVNGRCEALRQLSLIQRHLNMELERLDGEERLDVHRLTIHTLQTLPANHPFRERYDPANPVCVCVSIMVRGAGGESYGQWATDPVCAIDEYEYASVRDAVLYRMQHRGSEVAYQGVHRRNDAPRHNQLRDLASQPPPIWDCRTISTIHRAALEDFYRVIVLHGDQPGHQFEAHISITSYSTFAAVHLYTTERPVMGVGAARFPQTVTVVREVMRAADPVMVFGNQLDVALPPAAGGAGGGQGGGQTAGPAAAAAASSSAAAGAAVGYTSQHNGGDLMDIDSGDGPAAPADGQGGGGGSSSDLLQKIRSMRSLVPQLASDLERADNIIATHTDNTEDGALLAGSLSSILDTLTDAQSALSKELAEIAGHTTQVSAGVPAAAVGVSSSRESPAAAAGGAGISRGEKRKAAASSASSGDDGEAERPHKRAKGDGGGSSTIAEDE
ncbi:unnamed protein product [Vitrella brassicaformis CCMP3155]|uniref:F-box domain-containing protein n=1 Tax=Vitrella brassicaformis (strain CCMP3155) TaxID=1169540 RepID=A0A0G4ETN1_VITBC|nr:unnamed protein product [Vitrella brassicaformis CCMP3155]|eukprot:CEM01671.1 unnamed protein product [Vitrella brassicaformis CCMP3155]